MEINDTPLRFSRTLNEAFPYGAEYGCAITHYRRPMSVLISLTLRSVIVGAVLGILYSAIRSYL